MCGEGTMDEEEEEEPAYQGLSRLQAASSKLQAQLLTDSCRSEHGFVVSTPLGVLFKHFLFCVIISMKETFKNIFSWG